MPSKRATARPLQPSQTAAPEPDDAKLEHCSDELLRYCGITADTFRHDVPEGREGLVPFVILLAMAPALGLRFELSLTSDKDKNILRRVDDPSRKEIAILDEATAEWFLNAANKRLIIDRVLQVDPSDRSKPPIVHHFVVQAPPDEQQRWVGIYQSFTPEEGRLFQEIVGRKLLAYAAQAKANPSSKEGLNRAIKPEDTEQWRRMLDYNKSFVQDGVRYFPLSAAVPVVQATAPTILHWIKNDNFLGGPPLQSCYFAPSNQYFIGEDAIFRAANRFIKWPSRQPAGAIILGETKDKGGYIRLPKMAEILGVDHHTIWRWATKGTAPVDRPLDVIKDPASDQFHIRQTEAALLKKLVPRRGLHAGRRPRPEPMRPK